MPKQTEISPVFVELKPDRNLLDPNFSGYKLSLEKLASSVISVKSGIDRAQPSEQQFSLQHVKQFAIHNHIFSDPFNPFVVYVVDKQWTVLRVTNDFLTRRLQPSFEVWRIPRGDNFKEGRFNVTITFPDNEHVFVSDGCGVLYILKTGDRKRPEIWTEVTKLDPFSNKSSSQFCVLDSTKFTVASCDCIDLLALRIDDKNDWTEVVEDLQDPNFKGHNFLTVLEWITLLKTEGGTKWILKSRRTLIGHSGLEYASIESGGKGLILASESKFHLVFDSEKPIDLKANKNPKDSSPEAKPAFVWTQTMEEIKLWFKVPFSITKRDLDIEFKHNYINVSYKKRSIFEGTLTKQIKVEGSYWIIETPKCLPDDAPTMEGVDNPDPKKYKVLEIVLEKDEQGAVWVDEVVKNGLGGQQISDPEFLENIHARLAHLCSDQWCPDPGVSDAYDPRQLEECDEYPADSFSLMRVDKYLQRISHLASLGSHQWLFNVRVEANQPPAICIRHDVDGIVWRPRIVSNLSDSQAQGNSTSNSMEQIDWNCEHIGTFSALGYVQASKQQRKYTICAPDISYVAICDVKKHIYLYRQPARIESCLRNRRTGEQVTHVAKQLVISLDPADDILGAYATPLHLYVLTPENFHAIRILAEEE